MSFTQPIHWPRPVAGDCGTFYFRYIEKLPDTDIITCLSEQHAWFGEWVAGLTPDELVYQYAPEKWTLGQMIGHVLDTERIFAYRMLAISRGETASLPGFDEDAYAANTIYDCLPPADMAKHWDVVRTSTLLLIRAMDEAMIARRGVANQLPLKVSAIPYILAGHTLHHFAIGCERYLQANPS